ncbi:hypothetical protein OGAPHI_004569 [Ogataea philodendri]|uniref:Uncharacterized protein n=1 Tax=Ogataea philodendri TaxID=1378263 RepID=A0A9P8T2W0_9ASCO|nr:uncharacterized protein OGAPHI_004569 [Ogataea philodendri]KAH3664218.1 hypothetical protein OGAPHI_004569 [Ogataea philodendri]
MNERAHSTWSGLESLNSLRILLDQNCAESLKSGMYETGVVTQIQPKAGIPSATVLRLLKNLDVRLASLSSTVLTMTSLIGASADWKAGSEESTGLDLEAACRNVRSARRAFWNRTACSATTASIFSETFTKGDTYSSRNSSKASMAGESFSGSAIAFWSAVPGNAAAAGATEPSTDLGCALTAFSWKMVTSSNLEAAASNLGG